MMEMLLNALRLLGAIALVILLVYVRWKSLERHVKDLEDGGIQTIFGSRKPK
jgi:HAMP domain-containing protein